MDNGHKRPTMELEMKINSKGMPTNELKFNPTKHLKYRLYS